MKRFLLFLFFLGLGHQASARPITHEDVWTFRRIGAPKVSPDGKWAVVSVTEPDYDKEKQVSDLWILPTDGSKAPRRLTSTPGSEGGVAWSQQGDKIVFTAKRGKDEVRQLYVLDMTGPGEAQRVSDFPLSCSSPEFTPDGKKILFEASVYPGDTDAEAQLELKKKEKDRKEKVSVYDGFPIRYWDHWLDGKHPRPYLLTIGSEEQPVDLLRSAELVKAKGFAGVSGLSGESLQSTVSPDGGSVLFVATTNRDQAVKATTIYRLYSVPISGGAPEQITGPEGGSVFEPTFGEDGKLYTLHEPETDFVYNLTELRVQDWPLEDQGRTLTQDFDLSVDEFQVDRRGQITLSATVEGRKRLFRMKPGSQPKALDPESRGVFSGVSLVGKDVLCRYEDGNTPVELVRVSSTGANKPLSRFNRERAAKLDWQPFQEFWFTSATGRKIHNWVVLPPNYDAGQKYPLVLFIHGGPHSSSLDKGHVRWSSQLLASGGYIVLLTDYTGSVGYGADFARSIQGDPLITPGKELHEAVDEAIKRYPAIDPSKVAASGASYGGHLVNWLQATSDRFVCLVGHAGLISLEGQWATSDAVYHRERGQGGPPWEGSPIWQEHSPSSYVDNFKTPQMLTIGEKDYRVPLNQTLAAWTYLQRMNVPSKLMVYHQANHWIMSGPDARHFWDEVHKWLADYLQ